MKIIVTFLIAALATTANSQLICYSCVNCEEIDTKSTQTVICGSQGAATNTTTVATPTTSSYSTSPTTSTPTTTVDSSTLTSITTPSTNPTNAPSNSNVTQYRCYKVEIKAGGKQSVERGCVRFIDDAMKKCAANNNGTCYFCSSDKCNAATAIITSVMLIFAALLVSMRLV